MLLLIFSCRYWGGFRAAFWGVKILENKLLWHSHSTTYSLAELCTGTMTGCGQHKDSLRLSIAPPQPARLATRGKNINNLSAWSHPAIWCCYAHTHVHKINKTSEGLSSSFDLDTNLSSPKFLSGLYPASETVNLGRQYLFRTILQKHRCRQSYCTLLDFFVVVLNIDIYDRGQIFYRHNLLVFSQE